MKLVGRQEAFDADRCRDALLPKYVLKTDRTFQKVQSYDSNMDSLTTCLDALNLADFVPALREALKLNPHVVLENTCTEWSRLYQDNELHPLFACFKKKAADPVVGSFVMIRHGNTFSYGHINKILTFYVSSLEDRNTTRLVRILIDPMVRDDDGHSATWHFKSKNRVCDVRRLKFAQGPHRLEDRLIEPKFICQEIIAVPDPVVKHKTWLKLNVFDRVYSVMIPLWDAARGITFFLQYHACSRGQGWLFMFFLFLRAFVS